MPNTSDPSLDYLLFAVVAGEGGAGYTVDVKSREDVNCDTRVKYFSLCSVSLRGFYSSVNTDLTC